MVVHAKMLILQGVALPVVLAVVEMKVLSSLVAGLRGTSVFVLMVTLERTVKQVCVGQQPSLDAMILSSDYTKDGCKKC